MNNLYNVGDRIVHNDHPQFEVLIQNHSHSHFYNCIGWDCKGKAIFNQLVWLSPSRTKKR